MRFTIAIPVRNGENYLEQAIISALNQKRPADEIIAIDDDSSDDTAEIIKSPRWNGRVKYFFNKPATGFVDAWNRAAEKATGDFVIILHHDDLLDPDYLSKVEHALEYYPHVRHVYAACRYIDHNQNVIHVPLGQYSREPVLYTGKTYAHNYLEGVIKNRHIHRCPGVATSKALLINDCHYRREAGHIADDDFFYRVGAYTDVVGILEPLASYREHKQSSTQSLDSLTITLARDYLFQIHHHFENETLFDSDDKKRLASLAVRFVNLLLFQSLLYANKEWMAEAFRLKEELNGLLPGLIEKDSPLWARIMWKNMKQRESNIRTALYVKTLHAAINMRDRIKAYLFF